MSDGGDPLVGPERAALARKICQAFAVPVPVVCPEYATRWERSRVYRWWWRIRETRRTGRGDGS